MESRKRRGGAGPGRGQLQTKAAVLRPSGLHTEGQGLRRSTPSGFRYPPLDSQSPRICCKLKRLTLQPPTPPPSFIPAVSSTGLHGPFKRLAGRTPEVAAFPWRRW